MICLSVSRFNNNNNNNNSNEQTEFLFATGGKENDLKVWDLNRMLEKKAQGSVGLGEDTDNEEKKINTMTTFRAKNMADNWMQLREPVWITSIDFIQENKVVVGTAHHQVRSNSFDYYTNTFLNDYLFHIYKFKVCDIKSGVRKPILNLSYGEKPITSMICLPDNSK